MLNQILNEAKEILAERSYSATIYSGWGTYLDSLIDDYIDQGGSMPLVNKVLRLAYK